VTSPSSAHITSSNLLDESNSRASRLQPLTAYRISRLLYSRNVLPSHHPLPRHISLAISARCPFLPAIALYKVKIHSRRALRTPFCGFLGWSRQEDAQQEFR